ncbi:DUF1365 domain-containing protein [Radicibacter daui]|uniref:DUF1365 domain-containing protein n=1 Tax=Radicibacter daui TaxID=3064829 RepID=UPI004046A7DB
MAGALSKSALYIGEVTHRRLRPRRHDLRYRCYWLLLDLDELEQGAARPKLFSLERLNLFSFYRRDHGDGSQTSLRDQAEAKLAAAGIGLEGGRITLFAMPRLLGYAFNPLSLYFCHSRDGSLRAILYEVHNTFGERHTYVLPVEGTGENPVAQACDKRFHVSPFMAMEMSYRFRVRPPQEKVSVAIAGHDQDGLMITAALSAQRQALTDAALLKVFFAIPLVTFKVIVAIHFEALRLWLKRIPFYRHPGHAPAAPAVSPMAETAFAEPPRRSSR